MNEAQVPGMKNYIVNGIYEILEAQVNEWGSEFKGKHKRMT